MYGLLCDVIDADVITDKQTTILTAPAKMLMDIAQFLNKLQFSLSNLIDPFM